MTSDNSTAGQADDADTFDLDRNALYDRVAAFMDEEDIADSYAAALLLDLTVRLRMTAYAMETEKPSVAGLKLDLDRLSRDVEELVREAKREAPDFIEEIKAELAAEGNESPQ